MSIRLKSFTLSLGQEMKFSFNVSPRRIFSVKFIQTSGKGFNFLNLETHKVLLKRALYCKEKMDDGKIRVVTADIFNLHFESKVDVTFSVTVSEPVLEIEKDEKVDSPTIEQESDWYMDNFGSPYTKPVDKIEKVFPDGMKKNLIKGFSNKILDKVLVELGLNKVGSREKKELLFVDVSYRKIIDAFNKVK